MVVDIGLAVGDDEDLGVRQLLFQKVLQGRWRPFDRGAVFLADLLAEIAQQPANLAAFLLHRGVHDAARARRRARLQVLDAGEDGAHVAALQQPDGERGDGADEQQQRKADDDQIPARLDDAIGDEAELVQHDEARRLTSGRQGENPDENALAADAGLREAGGAERLDALRPRPGPAIDAGGHAVGRHRDPPLAVAQAERHDPLVGRQPLEERAESLGLSGQFPRHAVPDRIEDQRRAQLHVAPRPLLDQRVRQRHERDQQPDQRRSGQCHHQGASGELPHLVLIGAPPVVGRPTLSLLWGSPRAAGPLR